MKSNIVLEKKNYEPYVFHVILIYIYNVDMMYTIWKIKFINIIGNWYFAHNNWNF